MVASGGQRQLVGNTLPMLWARQRPITRPSFEHSARATRNLYVANDPGPSMTLSYSPFSPLSASWSRCARTAQARRVHKLTNIASAFKAKEAMHCKPIGHGDHNDKPLLINFTSAQQNCMRARTGRGAGFFGERGTHGEGGCGRSRSGPTSAALMIVANMVKGVVALAIAVADEVATGIVASVAPEAAMAGEAVVSLRFRPAPAHSTWVVCQTQSVSVISRRSSSLTR